MIQAQLIAYNYDLTDHNQAEDYKRLTQDLKKMGLKVFATYGGGSDSKVKTGIVNLDTSHVFDNQWNTTDDSPTNPKLRVMDWCEPIIPNKRLKRGYYIVPNDHIHLLRATTFKCGYCGAYSKETGFCGECIGTSCLTEDNLHLLRLQTVLDTSRAPLTEDESNYLLPLYYKAQSEEADTEAGSALRARRQAIKDNADKAILHAKTERDGFLWLMNAHIKTDNCIYYSHTNTFSFGWRSPINPEARKLIETALQGFPFNYEFK